MRILLIDDDPTYRRLIRQHLATAFDGVVVVDHVPRVDGGLIADFNAVGYDAVLLDQAPAGGSGLDWIADGRARPLFPPVIYMLEHPDEAVAAEALRLGAFATVVKTRIDHRQFVQLVLEAEVLQRRALGLFRSTPAAAQAYLFGDTAIRGVRCIRTIATSAISSVYLAESEREARLVVLKLLREPPDGHERSNTFDRFLQEYEIIRGIQHPNVVEIYELGVADDHVFILMEYFASGDLRARMRRGVAPAEAVRILRQMGAALAAIHAAGVLHRDLKPGNVMMRADGSVALIDFGLAKQLTLEAEITATGEIFGTPYYMSPEQGHGRDVDARSDLYSLGIIFYEMLMRKKPYLAPTPMAVIYKHSHSPIPTLPPEFAAWQGILEGLIGKEPVDRFQSATELCAAIDAQLAVVATAAPGVAS